MVNVVNKRLNKRGTRFIRDAKKVFQLCICLLFVVGAPGVALAFVDIETFLKIKLPFLVAINTMLVIGLVVLTYRIMNMVYVYTEDKQTQTDHSIEKIIQEYITENRDEIISDYLLNASARKYVAIQMENIYDVPRRITRTRFLPNLAIELPIPELSPELLTTYDIVRATIENTNSTLVKKGKHKRSDSGSVSSMDSGIATLYGTELAASDLESEQDPLEQISPSISRSKKVTWSDLISENDSKSVQLE